MQCILGRHCSLSYTIFIRAHTLHIRFKTLHPFHFLIMQIRSNKLCVMRSVIVLLQYNWSRIIVHFVGRMKHMVFYNHTISILSNTSHFNESISFFYSVASAHRHSVVAWFKSRNNVVLMLSFSSQYSYMLAIRILTQGKRNLIRKCNSWLLFNIPVLMNPST